MPPLVSCVLATRDRGVFVRQALAYFAAQDYPNKELVVVDDGDEPIRGLCNHVAGVRYIRLTARTPTGTKLNVGIEAAGGNILQKIDDDDFYGPRFLSLAVERLTRAKRARALVAWCCFTAIVAGEPCVYFSGHGWNTGGTLCFRRGLWRRQPFRSIYTSSDSWFIRDHRPPIARVCAPDQYLVVRHGRNTWQRLEGYDSVEEYLRGRRYPRSIGAIVGRRHAPFYRSLMCAAPHRA